MLRNVGHITCWPGGAQVYGIVACQLGLTALVAAVIMFNAPVQHFVLTNTPFQIINVLLPFISASICLQLVLRVPFCQPALTKRAVASVLAGAPSQMTTYLVSFCVRPAASCAEVASPVGLRAVLIPLYMYKDKHPVNLLLLGGFVSFPISSLCLLNSCVLKRGLLVCIVAARQTTVTLALLRLLWVTEIEASLPPSLTGAVCVP